jgi:hypothetical protein
VKPMKPKETPRSLSSSYTRMNVYKTCDDVALDEQERACSEINGCVGKVHTPSPPSDVQITGPTLITIRRLLGGSPSLERIGVGGTGLIACV